MHPDVFISIFNELQALSQAAAQIFIASLWQGCLLAASVAACLKLAPRTSAGLRFTVWSVTFLVLAALPWLHFLPIAQHFSPLSNSVAPASNYVLPLPSSHPLLQLDVRWSLAILALWGFTSLYRLTNLAMHCLRLRALLLGAKPFELPASKVAQSLCGKAEICTTKDLDRPSVIGFFAPRILIPEWLAESLTPAEMDQVLLHEAEHLHRRDDWSNLLQKLSLALFPINPALLWIERKLCLEREMACDEGVIEITHAPRAYATCLTRLAEFNLTRRTEALSLGALHRRPELVHRVHKILSHQAVLSPLGARMFAGFLAISVLAGAVELARTPQLVAFVTPQHAASPIRQAQAAPQTKLAVQAGIPHPVALVSAPTHHRRHYIAEETAAYAPSSSSQNAVAESMLRFSAVPVLNNEDFAAEFAQNEPSQAQPEAWLLTTWQQPESQPGQTGLEPHTAKPAQQGQPVLMRLVFTVRYPTPKTFAAVPTRDGWLVIQL